MNVLLDASLPPRMARALHHLASPAHRVEHVRDVIGNDATDAHLADHLRCHPDTVLIGIDLDTATQPHRVQALLAWHIPVMLLHADWLSLNAWDQAWHLAAGWRMIIKKVAAYPGPAVYLVPLSEAGRIRKIA